MCEWLISAHLQLRLDYFVLIFLMKVSIRFKASFLSIFLPLLIILQCSVWSNQWYCPYFCHLIISSPIHSNASDMKKLKFLIFMLQFERIYMDLLMLFFNLENNSLMHLTKNNSMSSLIFTHFLFHVHADYLSKEISMWE